MTSCSFQFMCEEGSVDFIARVDEPQSCRYVLTVHTSRVCQHPFLKPPSTAKPYSIVCQPALSAKQYMDYVNAQVCTLTKNSVIITRLLRERLHFFFSTLFPLTFSVADTKRKVEQISEELKNLDEMLASKDGADGPVDTSEPDGASPVPHGDADQTDREGTSFY